LNAFAFVSRTTPFTISTGGYQLLTWEQEDYDSAAFWNPAQPSRLTVAENGVYMFHCSASWNYDATGGHREVGIRYNGAGGITSETTQAVSTASLPTTLAVTDTFAWTAGAYAECLVQDTASATTTVRSGNAATFFYVVRIQ
jgi:hypothetical protein